MWGWEGEDRRRRWKDMRGGTGGWERMGVLGKVEGRNRDTGERWGLGWRSK